MGANARARYTWLIIAGCAVLALLESAHTSLVARVHGESVQFGAALLRHLPVWAALALLIPLIGRACGAAPLYGATAWRSVTIHGVASALFPFVHMIAADVLRFATTLGANAIDPAARMSLAGYVLDVLLYWLILGAHTVHALQRRHARDVAEAAALRLAAQRLEVNLIDANLQALRWQLNPHFLFNALNSLSVLAEEARAARVVAVIAKLSALLRSTLEQREPTTTLEQEVVFLTRYLDFERVRFEDRLDVEWVLAPDCLSVRVPTLVLQPLVENALKHGVDHGTGRASVVIGAARQGDQLRLWVTDRGPGLSLRNGEREGVGLRNTRDRLKQLFGSSYTLQVEPAAQGGVTATIVIPCSLNGTAHILQESLR